MARIRPFRGLRYRPELAAHGADLLAPPYDVIDDERRAELAGRSPYNCVHVILPEGEDDRRYERAAEKFREMVKDALTREPQPGFYVYHQQFSVEGQIHTRKGIIGLVELTRFGAGPILPHERTLAGPKEDRLKLMRACDAHLELVFGLFPDPERAWEGLVDEHLGEPVLSCTFDEAEHRLFCVTDAGACADLVRLMADRNIYIADGHHRYETMCHFRDELEQKGRGGQAAYGMIYLSNADDPGLVVLPTHRVVHGLRSFDWDALVRSLSTWFDIQAVPMPGDSLAVRRHLEDAGKQAAAFGLAQPGGSLHILRLRRDADLSETGVGDLPQVMQHLDVVLLHELVLEHGLGITKGAQEAKTNLRYLKSTDAALDLARGAGNDAQLVCFMNPTPVADVRAVCDSGRVMPQKSTFFYPKIPTGLVFYDLRLDGE